MILMSCKLTVENRAMVEVRLLNTLNLIVAMTTAISSNICGALYKNEIKNASHFEADSFH